MYNLPFGQQGQQQNQQQGGYPYGYPQNHLNMAPNYYGGYNQYMNPYLLREQRMKEQEELKKQQQSTIDRVKKLSKIANTFSGEQKDDEYYAYYDKMFEVTKEDLSVQKFNKLAEMKPVDKPDTKISNCLYARSRYEEKHDSLVNRDADLFEFLENAGDLYRESLEAKHEIKKKDISGLYNQSDYRSLIRNRTINQVFKNTTLDDDTVTLPDSIKNEYSTKRQKFFEALMNPKGGIV